MDSYNPVSIKEDREYIGAVYRLHNGQGFVYSFAPGVAGSNEVRASVIRLKDASFVSFWHTHGADHWTRKYFSNTDTGLVNKWQLPLYMACADGKLRVFRPDHRTMNFREARQEGLGTTSGYARGETVPDIRIQVQ
jgi:hypothetical protein